PLNQCSFILASQTVEPSTAWKSADCDNDGLTNQQEKDLKTDPLVSDTDGDGVIDGKEVSDNTNPLDQCSLRLESQTLTPSNAWLNGDCNGDGIRNGQNLLISMYATAPQLQSDGSFNLKYIVRVQNLRPERVMISGIQKNLTNTFRLPTTFRVTGVRGTSTGHLLAAASYDGRTQLNVVSTGSGIGGYTLDSVTIDVNVVPNGFSGSVQSTATLTGTGAFNFTLNTPSTDVTVTGGSFPAGGAPTPAVIPVVTYIIPDAFSPNRDGINDRFVVIRPYQSVISLQVFNRWGNVVYRSDNYNNEWDGRGMSQYGGGDLPEGTYFYLIRSREQSGEVKQFKGSIMLKR
ncbi:MAG: gliding motility-associated C-terminal domain-containing protein, partial [Sediminibacterium sp.]